MKNIKRVILGVTTAVFLTGLSVGISADMVQNVNAEQMESEQIESNTQLNRNYGLFSGTIKEITNYVDTDGAEVEGKKFVLVENAEGTANFLVTSENTVFAAENELTVGLKFIGFYDANAPVLMIYPPQYNAEVIAVDLPEEQSIKVEKFDESLTSIDNDLKLNISEDTQIISPDGKVFEGELANKNLAVIYSVSTRSIPAQTSPIKVIVLPEKEVPPVTEDESEPVEENVYESDTITIPDTITDIVVNSNKIDAPTPFINDNGVVMIPLRAVAEALGYKVGWDAESRSVMLDNSITLSIDKDYYTYLRTAPIQLGTAPLLLEGTTFVPLSFFKDVARIENVSISNGQLLLDRSN